VLANEANAHAHHISDFTGILIKPAHGGLARLSWRVISPQMVSAVNERDDEQLRRSKPPCYD